ncbi:MAG: phenylalanine--tRNA ligase subunit alpha [Kiritimatiellia bacterium]|nr:phenylalanine--tRNA ligase subunit alpha [Lentisphaerota bacterium]
MNTEELLKLKQRALEELQAAGAPAALEELRVKYLGRRGLLAEIMQGVKNADPAERPLLGRVANEFKNELGRRVDQRRRELQQTDVKIAPCDWTLPGRWPRQGTRHPISIVIEEVTAIFAAMGFTVADGPDMETAYYNFDALNTPDDHPARDPQDTFWLADGRLLRTQTSPVQIRVMETQPPPVRIIAPGRVYRRDTTDATHSANFHQVEGLYVDRGVSMADLKNDITCFARRMMGADVKVRFRPHFFPFTEPSVEYDFSCHVCGGRGCRVCKNSGWIEISGAGLVHPQVFAKVNYDYEQYTGYAFGLGVERIAMIKYGIHDIRALYANDLRFLEQIRP